MRNRLLGVFCSRRGVKQNNLESAYVCEREFVLSPPSCVPPMTRVVADSGPSLVTVGLDGSYTSCASALREYVEQAPAFLKCGCSFFIFTGSEAGNEPGMPAEPAQGAATREPVSYSRTLRSWCSPSTRFMLGGVLPRFEQSLRLC